MVLLILTGVELFLFVDFHGLHHEACSPGGKDDEADDEDADQCWKGRGPEGFPTSSISEELGGLVYMYITGTCSCIMYSAQGVCVCVHAAFLWRSSVVIGSVACAETD